MLNYIRADLGRLFRGKSLYIIILALFLLMLTVGLAYEMTTRISYEDYLEPQEGMLKIEPSTQLSVQSREEYERDQAEQRQQMTGAFYLSILSSQPGIFYLAFSLFFSLFLLQDYTRGYLKNILNIPRAKTKWILSKMSLSLLSGLIYLGLMIVLACGLGLWKTGQLGYSLSDVLAYGAVQLSALVGLSAIQVLLVILFQQTLPAVLIGVALAMNFQAVVLGLIDNLHLFSERLAGLTLMGRVYQYAIGQNPPGAIYLIGLVYFIVFPGLAWLLFQKSDIRC